MIQRPLRAVLVATSLLLLTAGPARAQDDEARKKQALTLYEQGTTQYNLGRWDRAVPLFEKAYETYPAPAFLFNIGQSHRQAGDCKQALFFYRRYLSVKPDAANRGEVEGFIADLEETCKRRAEDSAKPPTTAMEPTAGDPATEPTEPAEPEAAGARATEVAAVSDEAVTAQASATPAPPPSVLDEASPFRPELLVTSVTTGPAFLGLGDLETPAQVTFAVAAGYPIAVGPATVDVGVFVGYTPVPYDDAGETGSAGLTRLLANAGASFPIAGGLGVRAELGVGVLLFSGLGDAESFFLEPDSMATGALSMPHLRVAVGAEYAVTDNLLVHLQPVVFGYSPAKSGLREDIGSITDYELLLGVGYRL